MPFHPGSPPALTRLLSAEAGAERENAWADLVAAYNDILLRTCGTLARDRDAAMDGYAYVLEALREDDCHRLRAYVPDGKTRFTTWLVVVTRRLLLDHFRRRYGRPRSGNDARRVEHAARRRLTDLLGVEVDPDTLKSSAEDSPDAMIRSEELATMLRLAVAELDPADQLLLALRFTDDRPVREIATILGLPTVFHVYRRLGIVVAALRRSLARRGVEGPEA
jgi:RNA polymerase sigma factor (sigma-70 family)